MFLQQPEIGRACLPREATFWMPRREDIDEEGIGCFFRDVWFIGHVGVREARRLISRERVVVETLGQRAKDEQHFDRLARLIENGSAEEDQALETTDLKMLQDLDVSDEPTLESLEAGVAGLVYALASVGFVPAASCRGHPAEHAWSESPVVLFAATRHRAEALEPLAQRSGCRFDIDEDRPDLLVLRGSSVVQTMSLAKLVLDERKTFVAQRGGRRREESSETLSQEPLF